MEQNFAQSCAARLSAHVYDVRHALGSSGPIARITRGAGWTLLSYGLGGVLGFACALALARWLGADGFGAYGVAWSTLTFLTFPATFGVDKAALRFVPEYSNAPSLRAGLAYPALVILIAGQLVNAGTGSVGYLTPLTGDQRGALVAPCASAIVALVLGLLLIPGLGVTGAAVSTTASLVMWNLWLLRRVVRRLCVYPAITDGLKLA